MSWKYHRRRDVRREVTFDAAQWQRIETAMSLENERRRAAGMADATWSEFARERLAADRDIVIEAPLDLHPVTVQLARIGGNINQIAHHVNLHDSVSFERLVALQTLLEQARDAVSRIGAAGQETDAGGDDDNPWRT